MAEWDLEKYYWPKDRVERWWEQGWDWDSLLTKPCPFLDGGKTLADYYADFTLPHPTSGQKVPEKKLWGDRWLTKFAGKLWTPYHLPLYDLDGNLSPKHPAYAGPDEWKKNNYPLLEQGIRARIKAAAKTTNTPLSGIVVPPDTRITTGDSTDVNVNFTDALFGNRTNFSGITFRANAEFSNASFGTSANFNNAEFCNGADFSRSQFEDSSTFNDVIFKGNLQFHAAQFKNSTNFKSAKFGGKNDFLNAVFGNFTTFQNAEFSQQTKFHSAHFGANTVFVDTIFKSCIDFQGATFDGKVEFNCLTETNLDTVNFRNVAFKGIADFSNREFIGTNDFSFAEFANSIKITTEKLSAETLYTFKNSTWKLPKASLSHWLYFYKNRCGLSASNETYDTALRTHDKRCTEFETPFRFFKSRAMDIKASEDAYSWGALETRCRIRMSTCTLWEKFFSSCYTGFSNYGQSIGLPVFWLFVSLGVSTIAAYFAALPPPADFSWDNLGFAATTAWHNLVPGGFIRDVFQGCHDEACRGYRYGEWSDHLLTAYGFWLYFVTGIFAAFNLALWFLFGLALKRRFQIK